MLQACTLILLQIRLDLAFSRGAKRGLVDRADHHLVVVGKHSAVEACRCGHEGSHVYLPGNANYLQGMSTSSCENHTLTLELAL